MKSTLIALVVLAIASTSAAAQSGLYGPSRGSSYGSGLYGSGSNSNSHQVDSYTTNRGTSVDSYRSTNPNHTQMDNYSTRGNVNPYTGAVGRRTPRY